MAKAPAAKQSTAVTNWEAALAQAAQKQTAGLASLGGGSNWLSFRGAQLTADGAAMPGSKADAVIFSYMKERAFYEGDFDPDSPASPVCYAYGPVDGGAALVPHEKASQPQAKTPSGYTWDRVTNDLNVCNPSNFAYSYHLRVPVVGLWACSVQSGWSYSQTMNQLNVCNPSNFAYSYKLS